MAKPSEFWMASALPTICGGQALADIAENCGESATTLIPHSSINASSNGAGKPPASGKTRQHAAEVASARGATPAIDGAAVIARAEAPAMRAEAP